MKRILCILTLLGMAFTASAQVGRIATELSEQIIQKLGPKGAKELVEMGGEAGVRTIIQQAAAEGGETAARQVATLCERFGTPALLAVKASPAKLAASLGKMPDDLVEAAIHAAGREPELLGKLVAQIGDDALLVAARHPGVGTQIAGKLGKEGVEIARDFSTPDAIRLARNADDIAKIAPAERAAVLAKIRRTGTSALDYLERHPKLLATTAGVGVFLAVKDDLLGTKGAPGFVERIVGNTVAMFKNPLSILLVAIAALIFARVGFIVVRIVRHHRANRSR
jgi:hypothetical protein